MIQGSCHCGAIHWRFAGEPDGATACNCTVCRRYGVLWAYGYEGEGVTVSGATRAYAEPQSVARIPIDHFDGLATFEDIGRDGRCVADYWW